MELKKYYIEIDKLLKNIKEDLKNVKETIKYIDKLGKNYDITKINDIDKLLDLSNELIRYNIDSFKGVR